MPCVCLAKATSSPPILPAKPVGFRKILLLRSLCSLGNASQLPAPEALAIPVVVLLLAGDPRFDDDDDDNSDRTGSSEDTCGAAAVLTLTAGRHPRCRGLNAVQEVTRVCRCASSSKPVSTPAARLPLAHPVGD